MNDLEFVSTTGTRHQEPVDCRSEVGQTIGLVDAAIHVLREVARRDLSPAPVIEALHDLAGDPEVRRVLGRSVAAPAQRNWRGPSMFALILVIGGCIAALPDRPVSLLAGVAVIAAHVVGWLYRSAFSARPVVVQQPSQDRKRCYPKGRTE